MNVTMFGHNKVNQTSRRVQKFENNVTGDDFTFVWVTEHFEEARDMNLYLWWNLQFMQHF